MSIKLRKVELSNIRSHDHVVFSPNEEGITAIRGANGTGKSTLVDSIAWALYGTKPSGVSKTSAIYRNGATWGKDKCLAIVELEVDNQLLKVERRMITKAGAVECDVWEIDIDDNGVETERHVAGTAVSQVESYLRQRLRMDEKGFLAAVLVQQKQVDTLIASTAKERAQVIEKLTGISSITNALDSARSESNSLKKIASLSVADEDALTKMKTDSIKLEEDIDKKTQEVSKFKEKNDKASEEYLEYRNQVNDADSQVSKVEDIRQRVVELTARISAQRETLDSVIADKDDKKASLSRLASGANLEELKSKMSELQKKLRENESTLNNIAIAEKNHKIKCAEAKTVIDKSRIKELDAAWAGHEKQEAKLTKLMSDKESSKALIMSLNSDAKKIDRAIKVLTEDNGNCPTCLQHVDDVSQTVDVLNSQRDELLNKSVSEKDNLNTIESNINKTDRHIANFNILIDALTVSEELAGALAELEEEKPSVVAEITAINGEIDAHDKIYSAAKRQEDTKREYDRLLARAQNIANDIESMQNECDKFSEVLKNSGTVSPAALSRLRKKLDVASESLTRYSNSLIRSEGELSVFSEKFSHLKENIARGEDELKRHKGLLDSVEAATATTKVIEEFREDRIKNSIPVIEVYASDLLNRFTEGRFTRLKIDSKFNTTVMLADGTDRAVGLLSGGELSAAAMALRISISMLLNGGSSKNLIILDEVLVSQDVNRAELILSTVKEVCKGQVVIIAHNDAIDAIADNVVELGSR